MNLRALVPALGVLHITVARALSLRCVGTRRYAPVAFAATNSAILEAPVFPSRFRTPQRALLIAPKSPCIILRIQKQ
ncbi:hypothetical protein Hanom_Chr09g00860121 [Helianthus anomalus]